MVKAFIFNTNKCVGCNACAAACRLYNGWDVSPRNIYSYNEELYPDLPVINLSLACNHCENPACLEGCPAKAISLKGNTRSVIIDEEKCLGCRYCQWNCPFDAPKFNNKKRIVEKCNLCINNNPDNPSCATACPTGALSWNYSDEADIKNLPAWIPSTKLKPALSVSEFKSDAVKISPAGKFTGKSTTVSKKTINNEWSLLVFSFASMLAVTIMSACFIRGDSPEKVILSLIAIAGISSLFHLGKPFRAWRAVSNPLKSKLSREIYMFIVFSILSASAFIFRKPEFSLAATLAGLIFLIAIDSVYTGTDKKVFFHSGQTFLSALLLISYSSHNTWAFGFMVAVKVILSLRYFKSPDNKVLRFLRVSVTLIVWTGLVTGLTEMSRVLTLIIIFAELLDRIIFYIDFEPVNIKDHIHRYIKALRYEKKRG
ncbi:MAG TPA: DmsC/YnfH family molybdoenzyme membrane anchor subunit [Bacteroidales bacterium]|nr:DmsC/YnfH family molybdoenzyme membrane anchor subunit [Bacteroidales bacterium]